MTRIFDIDVDANGKLLVSMLKNTGSDYTVVYARLDPSATSSAAAFDSTFSQDGVVETTLTAMYGSDPRNGAMGTFVMPDGKFVTAVDRGFIRMNPDGSVDTTFGTNGKFESALTTGQDLVEKITGAVLTPGGQLLRLARKNLQQTPQTAYDVQVIRHGTPPTTAPGAPTIDSVTAGNGQLSIAFTAPASNGGATITAYEVSTDNGTSFAAASSTTSPIVVTGLTNGTAYSIKIRAVNSVGPGTASAAVSGTPQAPASGGGGSAGGGSSSGGSGDSEGGSTPATPTVPATTTPPSTTYANAVPGITVTDPTVYRAAPKEVAGGSAIIVLTPAQNRFMDVVSKTPSVCLPNDDDLVFLDEGKCIAEVVNAKTRKVLRSLKTTVVEEDISEVRVGNEVAVLAPLYFVAGTFDFKPESLARLAKLKNRITAAGSVLVAGHSGVLTGNTPENVKLSEDRAKAAVKELRSRGAKGPFAIAAVGALDPATTVKTQEAQDKNRRVVIVLIP